MLFCRPDGARHRGDKGVRIAKGSTHLGASRGGIGRPGSEQRGQDRSGTHQAPLAGESCLSALPKVGRRLNVYQSRWVRGLKHADSNYLLRNSRRLNNLRSSVGRKCWLRS